MEFSFTVLKKDKNTKARRGIYQTPHGIIQTPVFMPVGTQGTVKALSPKDLHDNEVQIILNNTYHMYLRPGHKLVESFGGLHKFISWDKPILTDSGGYQVFSLSDLNKITEEGVKFKSHIDGSYHLFTPENVMEIETSLGADIIMAFDECTPYPATFAYADQSQKRTTRWAKRCKAKFDEIIDLKGEKKQQLFGIVQGSIFTDLRQQSANDIVNINFDGYAIGGLSVGEPKEVMYEMIDVVEPYLPYDKPRYLMGVGMPEDIIEAVKRGVDMFDCVVPTRYGRNGTVFTYNGKVNIRNSKFKTDKSPIDENCTCYTCQNFSKGYLRHLVHAGEILGAHLLTLHNIHFFMDFTKQIRLAIEEDRFLEWANSFYNNFFQ